MLLGAKQGLGQLHNLIILMTSYQKRKSKVASDWLKLAGSRSLCKFAHEALVKLRTPFQQEGPLQAGERSSKLYPKVVFLLCLQKAYSVKHGTRAGGLPRRHLHLLLLLLDGPLRKVREYSCPVLSDNGEANAPYQDQGRARASRGYCFALP